MLLGNKQRDRNLSWFLRPLRGYIAGAYIGFLVHAGYRNIVLSLKRSLLASFRKKQGRILSKANTGYPHMQKLKDIDDAMPAIKPVFKIR